MVFSPNGTNVTNYSSSSVDGGTLTVGNGPGAQTIGFFGFADANRNGGVQVGTGGTSATLDLNGFSVDIFNLSGNANGIVTGSAGTITMKSVRDSTYGGVITGGVGITLAPTAPQGTLTLTNANTYTGGTTIQAGASLRLGNGTSTGSVTGDITNNGL